MKNVSNVPVKCQIPKAFGVVSAASADSSMAMWTVTLASWFARQLQMKCEDYGNPPKLVTEGSIGPNHRYTKNCLWPYSCQQLQLKLRLYLVIIVELQEVKWDTTLFNFGCAVQPSPCSTHLSPYVPTPLPMQHPLPMHSPLSLCTHPFSLLTHPFFLLTHPSPLYTHPSPYAPTPLPIHYPSPYAPPFSLLYPHISLCTHPSSRSLGPYREEMWKRTKGRDSEGKQNKNTKQPPEKH